MTAQNDGVETVNLAVTAQGDWFAHGVAVFLERTLPSATVMPAPRFADLDGLIGRGWPDAVVVALPTRREGDMTHLTTVRHRWPGARLLVLSGEYFPETAEKARALGASAYVTIACAPESIEQAARAASAGSSFYHSDPAAGPGDWGAFAHVPEDVDTRVAKLTPRERQIMEMLGRSYANHEIAEALNLREQTVRIYVHRIIRQLNLRNRVDVALCSHSRSGGNGPVPSREDAPPTRAPTGRDHHDRIDW